MDREKVIKEYEDYVNSYISLTTSHDYEFEMHKAVLAILKEQESVVRCKDCKYWSAERINDFNKCRRWINVGVKNFATIGDWFCADGEKRDETLDEIQKPVAPTLMVNEDGIWMTCPECKTKLWQLMGYTIRINFDDRPKYCPQCGKPIKWEKNKN